MEISETGHPEYQYLDILRRLTEQTTSKSDPQGVGSVALFDQHMRFDLSDGTIPLLTTKKIKYEYVVHELLWFLRGDTDISYLQDHGVPIWDRWATKEVAESVGLKAGEIGPLYGYQWRRWQASDGREIDQITRLVQGLKENPDGRRHMVTSFNPGDLDKAFLAPCHGIFKCFVMDGVLSLSMYQRSGDFLIGIPYNVASYSTLLRMLAQVTGLRPGVFSHTIVDCHLYLNHFDAAYEQLERTPRPFPKLKLNPEIDNIFDFTIEDFELVDYEHDSFIKAPVAL